MITQELKDFIKKESEAGLSKEDITKKLLDTGWKQEDIDNVFLFDKEKINSKEYREKLGIGTKLFLCILTTVDFIFTFYYAFIIRNAVYGMSNLVFTIYIAVPLFFINLIFVIYLFSKRYYLSILLLILILFGPLVLFPLSSTTSFTKYREARTRVETIQNTSRNLKQQAILSSVVEDFKKPHKVLFIAVDATTTSYMFRLYYLVLDNGYIVYLSNNPIELNYLSQDNFITWANKNLVNKEANFSLPNFNIEKDFKLSGLDILKCDDINYQDYQDFINKDIIRIQEIRTRYNIDKNKSNLCTAFPVNINFNEESLYDKFK